MFTGIIVETGKLAGVRRKGGSMTLQVRAPLTAPGAAPGDSVAIDGVCLTVTSISGDVIHLDVGEETYSRTVIARRKTGDSVNIEPSLRIGDKVGGHIVTGHVDAVGFIMSIRKKTTEVEFRIGFPMELAPYIAEKGAITVDGISLTVGEVRGAEFALHIIPHTIENTTLRDKAIGDEVNLEVDILARYVVRAMETGRGSGKGLLEMLVEYGYTGSGNS